MALSILKNLKKVQREIKAATKAGDTAEALAAQKRLNEIIKGGVNSPLMPRAAPLGEAQIQAYAERMAPQIAGELTRKEKSAETLAGKSQKQFKREQTLPVDRKVLPGAVDPSAPLPSMTLEDKIGSVLLGLPGDPTLARVSLSGIGDVPFERAVTQHGGPRYGDENKLWASNLSAATGLLNAADRASRQFGDAPVVASYMKMPSGFGFAQHYLESLLQYQRPDLMNKAAREALEKDIKAGFIDSDGKRVTFPNFPGFDDLGAVAQAAESNSILRKHIAAKLGTSEKYGLRPAADVQFAVSHPELTNLETGASGFTLGELTPSPLTESAHPSYSYDIPGKVLGQMQYSTPYDLLYRDQLELIRQNPKSPEFNTLKLLGARQQIDEQLVNEINEYQERVRRLIGKKKGGAVKKAEGGTVSYELPDDVTPQNWRDQLETNVLNDARALIGVKEGGPINLDRLLEKAVRKANGGPANLDDMLKWAVAKHNHKMKKGGEVSQTFPLKKDEEEERMFSPAPLKIPPVFKETVDALKAEYERERQSMNKPRASTDTGLGIAAEILGSPMNAIGDLGKAIDHVQKTHPLLRKPASVMDSVDKTPSMGYAPKISFSPEGEMPYGSEHMRELMTRSGMTTGERRPLIEMAGAIMAPFAASKALKYGKAGVEALAPTAAEMLEFQLAQSMKPYQMAIAPEGKAGKVKAPANPVGFYNPAEKAALNLQRKQGAGSAFVSDLQKTPGVNQERLTELGLGDLASRPNVTRDEILAAAEQNRIPLRETVRRPYQESEEFSETVEGLRASNRFYEGGIQQMQDRIREVMQNAPDSPLIAEYERKIEAMKQHIDKNNQRLASSQPSLYGPDSHPDYNMPGGENYREIRVQLPKTDDNFMRQAHHGDEPNVLFHLRVADHTDAEGKKGLLIDELQSDWHQSGREKGYRLPSEVTAPMDSEYRALVHKNREAVEAGRTPDPKDVARAQLLEQELIRSDSSKIPNAPFKDNWYQLGLKRAIKEAADTGMDRVYLTTGARQADRYDLSKHIDELVYQNGTLHAYKDGQLVIDKTDIPQDKLQDYVGKDAAKKLIDQKPNEYGTKSLAGLDLKVGGEGMRQYYDKTYKNYLDKYAKQFGGRVGETTLPQASDIENVNQRIRAVHGDNTANIFGFRTTDGKVFESRWDAIDHEKRISNIGEKVYYIDITPKMIESAKKGQSYAFGGGVFNTDPDITDSGRIIPEHTI
jgi:hemerythrin-like domain-containing protein